MIDYDIINKEWHISKYVLFVENPDNENEIYCVHLMNHKCFILSREEFNLLFKINTNKNIIIPQKFLKEKLIINYDEYALFESLSRKNHSNTSLNLTICPTLNCNFNCPYCFENHRATKMSLETQNNIILFIKKMIVAFNAKNINITWFGGEPLLFPEIIESLSDKIINLAEEQNIKYKAKIITNGYLLTQEIVDMLENKKVEHYQITLDGFGENHNITRHLINGNSTFNRIIDNLKNIKFKGSISIRHNVHENNYDDIKKLKELIKDIGNETKNKINYYSTSINDNNVAREKNNQVIFLNKNRNSEIEILKRINFFTSKRDVVCGAQSLSFVSIDDQGKLFKCWEDVDKPERSFGDIKTWEPNNPFETAENLNILTAYFNTRGVLDDLECKKCIWLPICLGGCPTKRLFFEKKCVGFKNEPEKYALEAFKYYNNIKNKKTKKYN